MSTLKPESTGQPERTRPWTADETLRALLRLMRQPHLHLGWPSSIESLDKTDDLYSGLTRYHARVRLQMHSGTTLGMLHWANALAGPVTVRLAHYQDRVLIYLYGQLPIQATPAGPLGGPWVEVNDIVTDLPPDTVAGEMTLDGFRELMRAATAAPVVEPAESRTAVAV